MFSGTYNPLFPMKVLLEIRPSQTPNCEGDWTSNWGKMFPLSMCEKLTHGSNCHANKGHIPPRNMCVYCFALNSDLSVDIWEPNPDPAFARHSTMFGLIALGWVDWIDAGRVEDGTHNATGDLKCLRLMGMLSPREKHVDDTAHQSTWRKDMGSIIAAPM